MPSLIDNDVDHRALSESRFPVTELLETYLQHAGNTFLGLRDTRCETPEPVTAQDLWDYLGDFA